jgi:hypothetical protein
MVIKRKDLRRVVGLIKQLDPKLFYTIDTVSSTAAGVFPVPNRQERPALAGYQMEEEVVPAVEPVSV